MIFARGMHIRYELKAIIVSLDGDKEESYWWRPSSSVVVVCWIWSLKWDRLQNIRVFMKRIRINVRNVCPGALRFLVVFT
jgi:hypothetical protein